MEGQPREEISVPTGRNGVMFVVFAMGVVLGVRVVFAKFVYVGKESDDEEMLIAKNDWPEADTGGAVPVRSVAGRDVEFRVGKGTRMEALVALDVGTGRRSERGNVTPVGIGTVTFVPFHVGEGREPVSGYGSLPVALTEGKGRRAEPVVFQIGRGKRPDTDALNLVVKFKVGNGKKPDNDALNLVVRFTVGNGKKPDLGKVELAVEFTVTEGKKPDLGTVGYIEKLNVGVGRPEIEVIVEAVALTLGKMPADADNTGIKVGKGRAETEELAKYVGTGPPDRDNPALGVMLLKVGTMPLATVRGNLEMVFVIVVVPSATVEVPRYS